MNRKEKRRDKSNRKIYRNVDNENSELNSMIKIFVGVLVVFFAVYFAYGIYNGDFSSKPTNDTDSEVQFQDVNILAGTTFSIDKEEYYVMYYDFKGNSANVMRLLYDGHANSTDDVKMYLVDLASNFNKPYLLEEDGKLNTNPKNIGELKVVSPTLIKIKNNKVEKFITGDEEVSKYLLNVIENNKPAES